MKAPGFWPCAGTKDTNLPVPAHAGRPHTCIVLLRYICQDRGPKAVRVTGERHSSRPSPDQDGHGWLQWQRRANRQAWYDFGQSEEWRHVPRQQDRMAQSVDLPQLTTALFYAGATVSRDTVARPIYGNPPGTRAQAAYPAFRYPGPASGPNPSSLHRVRKRSRSPL